MCSSYRCILFLTSKTLHLHQPTFDILLLDLGLDLITINIPLDLKATVKAILAVPHDDLTRLH